MSLVLLFHYLLLNMFRMLKHPSSGACDLFDELLHGLYVSGSMCVGVALWWCVKPAFGYHTTTTQHQHTSNQNHTTHASRKLLRMDVLTSETCWAVNNEIIKQVTSSWSLFIQQTLYASHFIQYQILRKLTAVKILGSQYINSTWDLFRWRPDDDLLTGRNM